MITEKIAAVRDKNKGELDEKGDAIRKKAEILSQEEKMKIATKQMNMSPLKIIQMQ